MVDLVHFRMAHATDLEVLVRFNRAMAKVIP